MDQKKKRVRKTQLVATLVLSCFLASFSFVYVDAFTYNPHYMNFNHGSYEQQCYAGNVIDVVSSTINIQSVDIVNVIDFTFDAYYSGDVQLQWNYNSSQWQQNIEHWNILVEGGSIKSIQNTSGRITFHIDDQDSFQVIMHYTATITSNNAGTTLDPYFKFNYCTTTLTTETNHNNEYDNIKSIDTRLNNMNSTLSNIKTKLDNSYLSFIDIQQNVTDIEAYFSDLIMQDTNNTIDTDVEDLLDTIRLYTISTSTDVRDCENYLGNIRNQMTAIQDVLGTQDPNNLVPDILTCINNIVSSQTNLESLVTNIYNDVHSMKSTLDGIKSVLDNIDNTLDTITWINIGSSFLGYTSDFSNYSLNQGSVAAGNYFVFDSINFSRNPNSLFKIVLNVGNFAFPDFKIYQYVNGNLRQIPDRFIKYHINNRTTFTVYIMISDYSNWPNGDYPLVFDFGRSSYLYRYSYLPNNAIYRIDEYDIEYWQLISYFNELDILSAINNLDLSINVSNQDISNVTNSFDTDIDIIHNIENNYGLTFDTWDDQLTNNNIALDLTPYNATINLFKTNITSLWSSPLISLPIILSCLVFVFLVILG